MSSTTGSTKPETDAKVDMEALAKIRADAEAAIAAAQAQIAAAAAEMAKAEAQARVETATQLATDLTKAMRPVTDAIKAGDLDKAAAVLPSAVEAFSALAVHIQPTPVKAARSHRSTSGTSGRDDVKAFFSDPANIGQPRTNQQVSNGTGRSSGFVGNITRDLADGGWLRQTDDAVKTFVRDAPVETA